MKRLGKRFGPLQTRATTPKIWTQAELMQIEESEVAQGLVLPALFPIRVSNRSQK